MFIIMTSVSYGRHRRQTQAKSTTQCGLILLSDATIKNAGENSVLFIDSQDFGGLILGFISLR